LFPITVEHEVINGFWVPEYFGKKEVPWNNQSGGQEEVAKCKQNNVDNSAEFGHKEGAKGWAEVGCVIQRRFFKMGGCGSQSKKDKGWGQER
jgi:hypothetical protein